MCEATWVKNKKKEATRGANGRLGFANEDAFRAALRADGHRCLSVPSDTVKEGGGGCSLLGAPCRDPDHFALPYIHVVNVNVEFAGRAPCLLHCIAFSHTSTAYWVC